MEEELKSSSPDTPHLGLQKETAAAHGRISGARSYGQLCQQVAEKVGGWFPKVHSQSELSCFTNGNKSASHAFARTLRTEQTLTDCPMLKLSHCKQACMHTSMACVAGPKFVGTFVPFSRYLSGGAA